MTSWHTHTIVAAARHRGRRPTRNEFVIKSSNRQFELWYVNDGTKFLNVGRSSMGMDRHDAAAPAWRCPATCT